MARRTWMPTPTQAENDRAAEGEHVIDKEHDGSPILDDSGRERPPDPRPPDPEPEPEPLPPDISSITPTSAPLPDVELIVYASNYDDSASILFDGAAQPTVHVADGVLRAAISLSVRAPGST